MRRLALLIFGVACLVFVLAASPAGATSGTLTITSNTLLTEDHHGQIQIGADNITLDCAGHDLIGSGWDPVNGGDFAGINLSGRTGVTVKNCHVTSGFKVGFFLWSSPNNTLQNNSSSGNQSEGFALASSPNNTGNTLIGNTASDNGWSGFAVYDGSANTTLTANTASDNHENGFALVGSGTANNTLRGNTANGNNGNGFSLYDGASGNRLDRNVANDNTNEGFAANGVSGNTWTRNTANDNGWFGFWVGRGCTGNTLSENTAHGNGTLNAYDAPANTGNVWTKNTFGRPVFDRPVTAPTKPVADTRFTFTLPVTRSDTGAPQTTGTMTCDPSVAGKVLRHAESFTNGRARLSFVVPKTAKGKLLKVKVKITTGVTSATKAFTYKVT